MDTYGLDSIRGFQSILVDNRDNFWCTYGHGYAYFDGDGWIRTDSEIIDLNGVPTYETGYRTIEQAMDGNIWIGKSNGIEIIECID